MGTNLISLFSIYQNNMSTCVLLKRIFVEQNTTTRYLTIQKLNNNEDRVMLKGNMTKWPVQKQTLKTTQYTQNNKTQQTFRINCFLGHVSTSRYNTDLQYQLAAEVCIWRPSQTLPQPHGLSCQWQQIHTVPRLLLLLNALYSVLSAQQSLLCKRQINVKLISNIFVPM